MTGKVFVDTSVLVYSRDASEPEKQKQAMEWMARLWRDQTGRLSFQVLNEFYVKVTSKGSRKNNFTFSHPIFRSSSAAPQSQTPRNSTTMSVGLLNRSSQI